jgi:hypothetical protein
MPFMNYFIEVDNRSAEQAGDLNFSGLKVKLELLCLDEFVAGRCFLLVASI